jgi:hypothetical protein
LLFFVSQKLNNPCFPLPSQTAQSMYVRVKRAKTTMFLHVEPTETVLELKQKIQAATDSDDKPGGVPIDRQRLLMGPTFASVLEVSACVVQRNAPHSTSVCVLTEESSHTSPNPTRENAHHSALRSNIIHVERGERCGCSAAAIC